MMRPREDGYDITVASEIMAVLCLSKDITDLKERLGRIIVGYTYGKISEQKPVTAHDLHAEGAMCALLKDAGGHSCQHSVSIQFYVGRYLIHFPGKYGCR